MTRFKDAGIFILTWLSKPRSLIWDLCFYLATAALFYWPLVVGWATFESGDFAHHFLPFAQFLQTELGAWRLPLWNPYTYGGHPFLADIQAGVFYLPAYPFHLAAIWLDDPVGRHSLLQWEAIFHTGLAGFGVHWLVTTLTGRRDAGAVAGFAFMLSGYVIGYPPLQLAVLRSAIWLPFVMGALWRGVSRPIAPGPWLWSAIFASLIVLGGHAQTALFAAYALFFWVLAAIWSLRSLYFAGGYRRGLALCVGLPGVLLSTIGLSAAQLLPAWEFWQASVRTALDYSQLSGGLALRDTWQMVLPGVFTQFSPLHIGGAALVFAVFAGAAMTWGRKGAFVVLARNASPDGVPLPVNGRPVVAYFLLLSLFGLLVSFGGNAQLYPLLNSVAPGWDLFRGQERAAYLATFGLAMLAGFGVAWIPTAGRTLRKRSALILGGLLTLLVYGFGLLFQLVGQTAIGHFVYLWIAFYTLAFGLAGCLLLWVDGWSNVRSALLVLLLAVNLWVAGFGVNFEWVSPTARTAPLPEVEALLDARADNEAGAGGIAGQALDGGRVYNEFRIYENYGMTAQVQDVWGASPLRLATYAGLFDGFPLDRMWALTGVEYVITWRRDLFVASEVLAEFPRGEDATYLHRLEDVMPRVWAVAELVPLAAEQIPTALADHQIDLRRVAFVDMNFISIQQPVEFSSLQPLIDYVVLEPGRIEIAVAAETDTFLVVSENWMPGWQVEALRCDGEEATDAQTCLTRQTTLLAEGPGGLEPMPVNQTLVGLVVPPGQITFELIYRPASVQVGAFVSTVTLILMLFIGLVTIVVNWVRRPRASAAVSE